MAKGPRFLGKARRATWIGLREVFLGMLVIVMLAAAPQAAASNHIEEVRFSGTLEAGNCSAVAGETFDGVLRWRTDQAPNEILSSTAAIWGFWTSPDEVFTVDFSGGSSLSLGAIWGILVEDIPPGGTSTFPFGDLFEPAASTATTTYGLRLSDPSGSGLNVPSPATMPTAQQVVSIPAQNNFPFGNFLFAFDTCGFAWGHVTVVPVSSCAVSLASLEAAARQVVDRNTQKTLLNKIAAVNAAAVACESQGPAAVLAELAGVIGFTNAKTIGDPPGPGQGKTIPAAQAATIIGAANDVCVALTGSPCP